MNQENLGPAERILNTVVRYTDHMVHNRPGMVLKDGGQMTGVTWFPVTHRQEGQIKRVYRLDKVGKKSRRVPMGVLVDNNLIRSEAGQEVGQYRPAGLFPEVATWMYRQVGDVWKLDNEFAARWASYAFAQDHRDLKVVLSAFLLVQSRKGDPVVDNGQVAFYDEDFRDVGEAMMLLQAGGKDFNPKLLLRVYDVLALPGVAAINRELGFGQSDRKPFFGRWHRAVEKWLRYREENVRLLEGLVKAGFRSTVIELARRVGYKPDSTRFFEILRWKQAQAPDGRRTLAIGQAVKAAESWEGLTEQAICERIVKDRPGFKRIAGLLPKNVGLTRAIVAAAIEAGSLSDKDLIIFTPTLEELGLLQVKEVRERWEKAAKAAEDMRAANIASRVKSKEVKEKLEEAADTAVKKAVEEAVQKNIRVYFFVDVSSSMTGAIETAKEYVAKFLQGFPLGQIHVCVFNTAGREIKIQHASAAGVANAFKGISAGGGTDYGAGVRALQGHKPLANEDTIFVVVGDEEATAYDAVVRQSGLNPMAFGFLKVQAPNQYGQRHREYSAVRDTAANLGVPCFMIDAATFADPYAIPRTIRALVAATPVGKAQAAVAAPRVSLVDMILKTPLLTKPVWAA